MKTLFVTLSLISSVSFSGAVKDSLIEHEEAVYSYLLQHGFSLTEISNSNYAKGKNKWLAIASDVVAQNLQSKEYSQFLCTSYFSINSETLSTETEEVVCNLKI